MNEQLLELARKIIDAKQLIGVSVEDLAAKLQVLLEDLI